MKHSYHRILVVDRDPAFQIGLAEALGHEGLTVLSVSGSDLALPVLNSELMPDAILIDLSPGDICAAELLRRAHALRRTPVITTSTAPALRRIGPLSHRELPKPINLDELLSVLDELCGSPRSPAGLSG